MDLSVWLGWLGFLLDRLFLRFFVWRGDGLEQNPQHDEPDRDAVEAPP